MGLQARIGINLCFIPPGSLTGPGVYALRLIDELLNAHSYRWVIYCHVGLPLPDSWSERAWIRPVISTRRRPLRVAFEQLALPLLARRDRIDLLFSPAFVSPMWGAPKLVATIHDMYYAVTPESVPVWQRLYWRLFIPLTARRCDRLLAVSQSTARDIGRLLPYAAPKTHVTPLACAVEDVDSPGEPVPGIEPGFVLMVANIVANKNPSVLVKAASYLAARGRRRQFVHVGQDHHGLLEAAISNLKCTDLFHRLGRVSAAQLRWLYRNALCAVQPSLYEGFGIPVLEAQMFRTPVLCSNAASLPEVAGDGALFFPPHDAECLAALIDELASNAALRSQLIERGIANASRYSWAATAHATLNVFRNLLERK